MANVGWNNNYPPAGTQWGNLSASKKAYESVTTIKQTDETRPELSLALARAGQSITYVLGRYRVTNPVPIWYGNIQNVIETTTDEKTDTRERQVMTGWYGGIYQIGVEAEEALPPESNLAQIPRKGGDYTPIGLVTNASATKNYVTDTTITHTSRVVGYTLDAAVAICLGPGVELLAVYADDLVIWQGVLGAGRHEVNNADPNSVLKNGFIYNSGELNQAPDPFLAGKVPSGYHIGYVGVAYIIIKGAESTLLQGANLSFEVRRTPDALALGGDNRILSDDLNAASAAVDIMLNEWGAIGIDASWIDTGAFAAAGALFADEGLGVSYGIAQENFGAQLLRDIQTTTNSFIFADPETGLITIKPLRPNAYDVNTLIKLTPSNVSAVQRLNKPAFLGLPTHFALTYYNRAENYNSKTIVNRNPVVPQTRTRAQRLSGVTLAGVCSSEIAGNAFDVMMTALAAPVIGLAVVADRNAAELKQGDLFLLTWPLYDMVDFPVYVTKVREQDAASNSIVIECQQYARPSVKKFYDVPAATAWDKPDMTPKPPTSARAINAPWFLAYKYGYDGNPNDLAGASYPIFLVAGANDQQLAFEVRTPTGDVLLGAVSYKFSAKLAAPMSKLDGHREWIIPEVTLTNIVNGNMLVDLSLADVMSGQRVLVIDDEFFSYETVVRNNDGTITLKNVYRGLVDSVAADHAAGSVVYCLDNNGNRMSSKAHTFDFDPYEYNITSHAYAGTGTYPDDAVPVSYPAFYRLDLPLRPQCVMIEDERTEIPVNMYVGIKTPVSWKTRSRANTKAMTGRLEDNAPDYPEILTLERRQAHFVTLIDSANTEFELACSLVGDKDNNYTIKGVDFDTNYVHFAIPSEAATGPGRLRVNSAIVLYNADDAAADPDYWPVVYLQAFAQEEINVYINPAQSFEVLCTFEYEVE